MRTDRYRSCTSGASNMRPRGVAILMKYPEDAPLGSKMRPPRLRTAENFSYKAGGFCPGRCEVYLSKSQLTVY